jgi:hypothetical protein
LDSTFMIREEENQNLVKIEKPIEEDKSDIQ